MHGERLDELHRGGRFREDQEPLALQHEPQQSLPRSVAFADDDTDARTFGGHVSLHDPEPTPVGRVAAHADVSVVVHASPSHRPMGDHESSFAADADDAFALGGHRPLQTQADAAVLRP